MPAAKKTNAAPRNSVAVEDYLERILELINTKGYARVVDITTRAALRQMILPGAVAVGTPIIVGLLLSSALMARVNHAVSLGGFCLAAALGLYMIWKIIRTPGEL